MVPVFVLANVKKEKNWTREKSHKFKATVAKEAAGLHRFCSNSKPVPHSIRGRDSRRIVGYVKAIIAHKTDKMTS